MKYISCFILIFLTLLCHSTSAQTSAADSMAAVLNDAGVESCRSELIHAAELIIGKNAHRLYLPEMQQTLEMPAISGIIAYHDRHAQVRFQAQKIRGACRINVRASYVFTDSCPTIRTEVFKRWDLIGKLDDNTWVLKKVKRVHYPQLAYLSQAMQNQPGCLVSVDSDIDNTANTEQQN